MRYHHNVFARNGRGWRRLVTGAAVLVPALGACDEGRDAGGSAAPPTVTPEPTSTVAAAPALPALDLPDGVEVFVEFPRYLHLQRRLEVGFDNNTGDEELVVESVGLRTPLFTPVALDEPHTRVEAGRRRDLQIALGPAVCPAPGGPAQVEVVAEIGGVRQHGLIDVPIEPLQRISDAECGRELVLENVDVGFSDEFAVDDGVLTTALSLARRAGDEPIEVTNVRGSVLLELVPADAATPLAAMAPGQADLEVPVRLRVIRCDPHAVTESKKTFQLAVWIAVGDRDTQHLVISPEGALRDELQALIEACLRAESG